MVGVVATPTELIVESPLNRRVVPWRSIASLGVEPPQSFWRPNAAFAQLLTGEKVYLTPLLPGYAVFRNQTELVARHVVLLTEFHRRSSELE